MPHSSETLTSIRKRLQDATADEFKILERTLLADTRKGVQVALKAARNRIEAEQLEQDRLRQMYSFQREIAEQKLVVGLDEVGRGPLAGPLTVGAVVLSDEPIDGLNDSKKIPHEKREAIAMMVQERSIAYAIEHIEAEVIDNTGMAASLRVAFLRVVRSIESKGVKPEVILLDGNPMRLDDREINVIKGDGKCASIAAASIIAKVERDRLMCEYAKQYPHYGFEKCKGYASADHIQAIKEHGLCPLHRRSFCTSFTQESLF